MSKEEITNLKEEFFSEIKNLEKSLNLQISIKLKELNDENDKKKQKQLLYLMISDLIQ